MVAPRTDLCAASAVLTPRVLAQLVVVPLFLLAACGGNGSDDAGTGADAARDGAVHDGGTFDGPPGSDAGDAGAVDGGAGLDAGLGVDSGPPDAGRACSAPVAALPSDYVPRCAAATRTCVAGCADAPCRAACAAADSTAPYMGIARVNCAFCLQYAELECVDAMGCHDETAALQCCLADSCPDGSCIDTTCAAQHTAYTGCQTAMAPTCASMQTTGDFAPCYAP